MSVRDPTTVEASYDLETSVPTDLTISSFSDEDKCGKANKDLNIHFKDRRQFIHDLQVLKIELSQKNATIQSLQSIIATNTEIFEEKIKDLTHQKQLVESRLRTQLKISEEEAKHQINVLRNQIYKLTEKECLLNSKIAQYEENLKNLKRTVEIYQFSEAEYLKLKSRQRDSLCATDNILLKIHEHIYTFKKENDELLSRLSGCEQQENSQQKQVSMFREALEQEREEHSELKEKYNKLQASCRQVQSTVEKGNYAQENFERVKNERDMLEKEILDMKDENSRLRSNLILVTQEKESEKEDCALLKSKLALLQQECEHLEKQIGELTRRWGEAQDRACTIQLQLDRAKSSKVEVLERFMQTKDKLIHDYETSLKDEKERATEALKSFYEKEIRLLNEAKNTLVRQKQAAEMSTNEYQCKYEKLHAEICQQDNSKIHQVASLERELASKRTENQSLNLVIKQLHETLSEKSIEGKQLNSKVQTLEQHLESLRKTSYDQTLKLEKELGEKKARLEVYEKLDQELDEAVTSAAQAVEENADQALEMVSAQLSMPSTSRFTISRCVNLTRKVIELERKLFLMENEVKHLNRLNEELNDKLAKANELLDQVDQPYSYLISTVRAKEDHIQQLSLKLTDFLKQVDTVKKEKEEIIKLNDELRTDLRHVLTNNQELTKVKEMIDVLQKSDFDTLPVGFLDKPETKAKLVGKKVPDWYRKLKSEKR